MRRLKPERNGRRGCLPAGKFVHERWQCNAPPQRHFAELDTGYLDERSAASVLENCVAHRLLAAPLGALPTSRMKAAAELRTHLLAGQAIPALPLALDRKRRWSERRQRAV